MLALLCCHVELWGRRTVLSGHGNKVRQVAEYVCPPTPPRSSHRAVTCGWPTRKILPDLRVRCSRQLVAIGSLLVVIISMFLLSQSYNSLIMEMICRGVNSCHGMAWEINQRVAIDENGTRTACHRQNTAGIRRCLLG